MHDTPRPFFSVLIPTRNRSEIVGQAIQSVLDQTEPDFEIVLSDNDESPTATRDVVITFQDPRVQYHRTSGRLAMHENWDNAFLQARGECVLILEDKMRLEPRALERLRPLFQQGAAAVSYPILFVQEAHWPGSPRGSRQYLCASDTVIRRFIRFDARGMDLIPKGLDCCARRSLLEEIRAQSGTGFLFSYICPDYAFGFQLLAHVESFQRLDTPLAYIPNNWGWSGNYSNGQSSYRKDERIRQFLQQLPVSAETITTRVPIRSEFLWINLLLHDFFVLYRPRNRPIPEIHWPSYHAFVGCLLLIGRKLGADMSLERRELFGSLRRHGIVFTLITLACFVGQFTTLARRALVARWQRAA